MALLGLLRIPGGATPREVFSNSAVHLSITCGDSMGSGFVFFRPDNFRPDDPPKVTEPNVMGQAFLVTNKHVLPPEGKKCAIAMRATINSGEAPDTKTIEIPIVGSDGKYLNTVRLHPQNDVAVVFITPEIKKNKIKPDFVFTNMLGTKDKLKRPGLLGSGAALVGDEVYILGYPAGLFDTRNAYPIWRVGIIATSPLLGYAFPQNLQKAFGLPSYVDGFLIDAQVYPGSSGSVVVVKPQAVFFDAPNATVSGGNQSITYVLGIVSDSIPVIDSKLKLITRMGLGIVQSADAISATIEGFFTKK